MSQNSPTYRQPSPNLFRNSAHSRSIAKEISHITNRHNYHAPSSKDVFLQLYSLSRYFAEKNVFSILIRHLTWTILFVFSILARP
jgi:hypothetical protein